MSFFECIDIDHKLLTYCDLIDDYPKLAALNKYYYTLIKQNEMYISLLDVYEHVTEYTDNVNTKLVQLINNSARFNTQLCRYLLDKYNYTEHISDVFITSCKNGDVTGAKFIVDLGLQDKYPSVDNYDCDVAFRFACEHNYLPIAKWLFELGNEFIEYAIDVHECDEDAFRWACYNGNLEVAKWLTEIAFMDIHFKDDQLFIDVCRNGHFEVAKWLIELSCQPGYSVININARGDCAFMYSCRFDHLDIAKWLIDLCRQPDMIRRGILPINIHTNGYNAFLESCSNGNLQMAQWLIDLSQEEPNNYPINIHLNNDLAFIRSCRSGQLKLVKWLGRQLASPINMNQVIGPAIYYICMSKKLELVVWLIKLSNKPTNHITDIGNVYVKAFIDGCTFGAIDIVKWIYEVDHSREAHFINNDVCNKAILECCKYDFLPIAQWLMDVIEDKALHGMTVNLDDAFMEACLHGSLNVAKWLIKLGESPDHVAINIHADNDRIFTSFCNERIFTSLSNNNNFKNAATWLNAVTWLIELSHKPQYQPILVWNK